MITSGDPIFANEFWHSVMSRNSFQLLLRFLHFEDNENPNCESTKLYKIERITREIINNFKEAQDFGEDIVIDETMIPFCGQLRFRQYIPRKTHKYGIKLFKLTDPSGYTYNVQVYEGKSQETARDNLAKSTSVGLKLAEDYFNEGRTLTVDNFYTSVELANKCLEKSTHLQGTLQKRRKGTPQINTQIQKGQCITKERSGVVVGVWKDKRSVAFLSTKDDGKVVSTNKKNRKGEEIKKPNVILKYNHYKQGIDLSDQLCSYFSPLRKTVRWYHKVAFELLLNTAVVNAYLLHNKTENKLQIASFRKDIMGLTNYRKADTGRDVNPERHLLVETEERTADNRKKRSRYTGCYASLAKKEGPSIARKRAKLVSTKCSQCPTKPYYRLEHFQTQHKE